MTECPVVKRLVLRIAYSGNKRKICGLRVWWEGDTEGDQERNVEFAFYGVIYCGGGRHLE